jgi:succinate-semialdehyde dehydrogenase/glutarate-semialdehyde dehydrogenase
MTHPHLTKMLIGGRWQDASDGGTFEVLNPATEAVLARVANGTTEDALQAVEAAHAVAADWSAMSPRSRGEILRRSFEALVARREEFAECITLESGKAKREALGEVDYSAEFLRWYSEEAVRVLGEISIAPGGKNRIMALRQPIGVSVLVTPWNFPAAMITRKIGPALAAGCTVVLKPAKETPLTALALGELLESAGLPAGVVNIVPTIRSAATVDVMLHDPRVRKFSFTGSTDTGRKLLAAASGNVVKCSMELGGNAPFIVFGDADIDLAVESAMVAKMRNGGESCTAANRFYIQGSALEEFSTKFVSAMKRIKVGNGLDDSVQMGPLITTHARQKIASLVDTAISEGAKLLAGGKSLPGKGFFYEPTVLTHVSPNAAILGGEIFGPVAPIVAFEDDDEVITYANATDYGLVSFVHTRDLGRALRVAEALQCGMVGINRGMVSDPAAPFGGWKHSGIGVEGGHGGLLEYLETKYIAVEW